MKALLLIAIVGVAATAMGIGFLNAPPINVVAQDVGIGHDTLKAPITTALVGFHITAIKSGDKFLNQYDACLFKSTHALQTGSTVFCKLTDMASKVVAEGKKVLQGTLAANTVTNIPILTKIGPNTLDINNIADVTIVVQGP
jgi:hypothetical protein